MLINLAVEILMSSASPITTSSLMQNRLDFVRTSPSFTQKQASSYSPKSLKPGNDDWFANDDYGHYLRKEGNEYVMADLKGPGVVVRMWSANPMGTLRMYFDGETTPRVKVNMRDWVSQLQGQMPGIGANFAFWAGPGWNVYVPMPYQKSCKVTMEPGEKDNPNGLYYHVGYRTYLSSTDVKTFELSDLNGAMAADAPKNTFSEDVLLANDKPTTSVRFLGSGRIQDFHLNFNYADPHPERTLRSIWVTGTFDGEKTISAPLGDFLAAPFGHGTKESGDVHLRFDMPYKREAVFTFERNTASEGANLLVQLRGRQESFGESDAINYFHCDFSRDRGRTRPIRDMHMLDVTGEGYLVGVNLAVTNPSRDWWGEGDEKIYVDGESFPSTFGTGTEDFLNYAWGSPVPYWTAQGSQTYTSTPANSGGYCSISRFMTMDPIPFTKSLKFDLEMWHWADCISTFDRTVYWYGKLGSKAVAQARPSWKDLELPIVDTSFHVTDAIEGEKLKFTKTGGSTEIQGGFGNMSNDNQIWWIDMEPGQKLMVEVPAKDGEYELTLGGCFARDYGIHQLYWNGEKLGQPVDFYSDNLEWKPVKLGRVKVTGGKAVFTAECVGANPKSDPRKMFAVDYFVLKPVK